MKSADVVTIATHRGVNYAIKQISADPKRYVAFTAAPLAEEHLHRDGRTLEEAMAVVATSIVRAEETVAAVLGSRPLSEMDRDL